MVEESSRAKGAQRKIKRKYVMSNAIARKIGPIFIYNKINNIHIVTIEVELGWLAVCVCWCMWSIMVWERIGKATSFTESQETNNDLTGIYLAKCVHTKGDTKHTLSEYVKPKADRRDCGLEESNRIAKATHTHNRAQHNTSKWMFGRGW